MIQLHHWHQHHQIFFIISIVNVVITTRVWQEPEHLPPAATPMLICNRDAHRIFITRPMDATHHTSFPIFSTSARGRLRVAEVTNAARQRRHVQHQQRISAAGSIVFKRRSRGAKQLSLHCNSPTQPAGFVLKVAHMAQRHRCSVHNFKNQQHHHHRYTTAANTSSHPRLLAE